MLLLLGEQGCLFFGLLGLLLQGLCHLLQGLNLGLLSGCLHLLLLVYNALLDDGVDLFKSCPGVIGHQDLLLSSYPLVLLLAQCSELSRVTVIIRFT